jgi:anti-sigma regulatory factor (Ser/Thr protein kinase)
MSRRDMRAGHAAHAAATLRTGRRLIPAASAFSHAALLYRGEDEHAHSIVAVLAAARAAASAVHAALPGGIPGQVRQALPFPPPAVCQADMAELGRNPARIIPAGLSFANDNPGSAGVYCLWEPAWPARSSAEAREIARHEALCNLAFAGRPVSILCLYDAARLGDHLIQIAEHTHPVVISGGRARASTAYLGAGAFPPGCDDPLPEPARDAVTLAYRDQLRQVREFAAGRAKAAGLATERASDFVLAVSEVASNTLRHTRGGGVIHAWCTARELLCQVDDLGRITDPLVGRRRQPPDASGGHGLWFVNQVCDLVETRTGPGGTTTRLHMLRPAESPGGLRS